MCSRPRPRSPALFASTGNSTRAVSDISPSSASASVGSWCDCSFLPFSQVCEVATVTTDSQPDHAIAGKVGYIASVAEFTPKTVQTEELRADLVWEARADFSDDDGSFRLGQPISVEF